MSFPAESSDPDAKNIGMTEDMADKFKVGKGAGFGEHKTREYAHDGEEVPAYTPLDPKYNRSGTMEEKFARVFRDKLRIEEEEYKDCTLKDPLIWIDIEMTGRDLHNS